MKTTPPRWPDDEFINRNLNIIKQLSQSYLHILELLNGIGIKSAAGPTWRLIGIKLICAEYLFNKEYRNA